MWGSLDSSYAARRILATGPRSLRLAHIPLPHLLWEAHLLPTRFVLMLLANVVYVSFTPASAIYPALLRTFALCTTIRNCSFLVIQIALTLYEAYRHLCLTARAHDMHVAGIEESFAWRRPWQVRYLAERLLFPVAGAMYSAVPVVCAQVCHFWTEWLVYTVILKPVRVVLGGSRVV
jgi:hypothetical protein